MPPLRFNHARGRKKMRPRTEDRHVRPRTEDRGGVLHFATAECCISQQSDIFVRFNFARDRPPA
jgi:hypothetical protein